jgi:hypothetical protein
MDEEVVLVPAGAQSPIHGRAGVRAWMEPDALAQPTLELLDLDEVVDDKVLAYVRGHTRGIQSGIEFDWLSWAVFTTGANGLITRGEPFLPHEEAEARAAAGLSA